MGGEGFWQAVIQCDERYDGVFYYAVKTVGVYCRPSCKSRTPLERNVCFFETGAEAVAAGFRPCKRCRPDLQHYDPVGELAERVKHLMDLHYGERERLAEKRRKLGVSESHLAAVFQTRYGVSPTVYLRQRRLECAKRLLKEKDMPIADVADVVGFESLSAFYAFFKKHMGETPGGYRAKSEKEEAQP